MRKQTDPSPPAVPPQHDDPGELRHWVKNTFQILSSLLSLHTRKLSDPQAVRSCRKNQGWTYAISLVHEALQPYNRHASVDLAAYTQRLTQLIAATYEASGRVDVQVQADAASLDVDRTISYGLILTELVANALQHAFPSPSGTGRLVVRLRAMPEHYRLLVQDTGIGLPQPLEPASADSLGLWLTQEMAQQLGGQLTWDRQGGTAASLIFPRAPRS